MVTLYHDSFFLILLGILRSSWCLTKPGDLTNNGENSRDDFSRNISLLDVLVDSKCKQYSAGLQDQIDQLRAKVDQIENDPSPSGRNKRDSKKPSPAIPCPTSSSFCTYYYPDHHDAKLKKGNFSPATVQLRTKVDQIEMNDPPTESKRGPYKPSPPACSTSKSFCTYYYPDHPDASLTKGSLSQTVTNNAMLKNDPSIKIKGMPTSCTDLQKLGHSSNGFYSIKKNKLNNQGTQLETVYCDFKSSTDSNGFETRIGVVDVKSSAVYFYVERTDNGYGEENQKITFLKEVFNVGGGFDWNNQLFRAPYSGIYFFSISGSKDDNSYSTRANMAVKVNNEIVGQALSSGTTQYGGFSHQFSKKLSANDTVELVMQWGKTYLLYFTGFMLEEDLTI